MSPSTQKRQKRLSQKSLWPKKTYEAAPLGAGSSLLNSVAEVERNIIASEFLIVSIND